VEKADPTDPMESVLASVKTGESAMAAVRTAGSRVLAEELAEELLEYNPASPEPRPWPEPTGPIRSCTKLSYPPPSWRPTARPCATTRPRGSREPEHGQSAPEAR
jgi:hypothetical protein